MNKTELIDRIAESADISKASAGRALDAALDALTDSLKQADPVALVGFDTKVQDGPAPEHKHDVDAIEEKLWPGKGL